MEFGDAVRRLELYLLRSRQSRAFRLCWDPAFGGSRRFLCGAQRNRLVVSAPAYMDTDCRGFVLPPPSGHRGYSRNRRREIALIPNSACDDGTW